MDRERRHETSAVQTATATRVREKWAGLLRRLRGFSLSRRFPFLRPHLARLDRFLSLILDHLHYDRFVRYAVGLSVLLHLLFFLFPAAQPEAIEAPTRQQELLRLSPHTMTVVNAVARTSLAQRKVQVPKVTEVEVALQELEVPVPELGAVEIGQEEQTGAGQGDGTGGGPGTPGGQGLTRRPELLMLVPPVYPKDAEKNRVEGSVELRILVGVDGAVSEVQVLNSSGVPSMDKAAVEAAKRTRFRPGMQNGRRVPMWIEYPIQFALTKR